MKKKKSSGEVTLGRTARGTASQIVDSWAALLATFAIRCLPWFIKTALRSGGVHWSRELAVEVARWRTSKSEIYQEGRPGQQVTREGPGRTTTAL